MGSDGADRSMRVAGNIISGSIERDGGKVHFMLAEQYPEGSEPPPDTFKDDAQALAVGTMGRDGIFQAAQLQAKCASKYAPAIKSSAMSRACYAF